MGSNPSSTGLLNVSLGNNVPSGGPVYKGMTVELPDSEMNGKYSPGSCHEWVLLSCCKYQESPGQHSCQRGRSILDLLLTLTLNLVFLSGVIGRIMALKVFMPHARTCEYVILHGKGLCDEA